MRKSVLVSVALVFVLAACGGSSKKSKTAASSTTTTKAPPIAPETGLPDPSGKSLTRSALWVKVENTPNARPQTGIEQADVVYEETVDGGITRFITLYNSEVPEEVGPVRSVRPMDPNVVWPLGGVFVYSGGTSGNVAKLKAAPLVVVDENNSDVTHRVNFRSPPHNLYMYPAPAFALGGQPVPPPALFSYRAAADVLSATATPVDSFNVQMSNDRTYDVGYAWDPVGKTWLRSMRGSAFKVKSGAQIAVQNVIVQFTTYEGGVGVTDAEGKVIGNGEAWVFTDGKLIKGTWNRLSRESVTTYTDGAGFPIKLTPGRTWVEFAPVGNEVAVTQPPVSTTVAGAPTTAPR